MVWSGKIIPEWFGGIVPDKNRSRMTYAAQKPDWLPYHQFKVFRGNDVCHGARFPGILYQYQSPVIFNRPACCFFPGQPFKLLFYLVFHLFHQFFTVGYKDGACHFVVLRLGQHVGGSKDRIGIPVRYYKHFAGTGYHVNANIPENQPFGHGYIHIARTHYLVNRRYAFCTISKGGDCLGTPYPVYFTDAGFRCRNQYLGLYTFITGRCDHYYFFYPRHLCRNCIHQNR